MSPPTACLPVCTVEYADNRFYDEIKDAALLNLGIYAVNLAKYTEFIAKQSKKIEFKRDQARLHIVQSILDAIINLGLHPAIYKRDKRDWLYNIKLELDKKQFKTLLTIGSDEVKQNFVRPFHQQLEYVIGGERIKAKSVKRIYITATPFQKDEVNLYNLSKGFAVNDQVAFLTAFEDVTDNFLQAKVDESSMPAWSLIHPKIQDLAGTSIISGDYLGALRHVTTEFINIIKAEYKRQNPTGKDIDGSPLMQQMFGGDSPGIQLTDLSTQTGRSLQSGYKDLFVGVIGVIRNPIHHENVDISQADCLERLVILSHLLTVFDNRIK